MIYQISDVNRKNIYADEVEETRRMNNIMWTPELDEQLLCDLNEYVVKPENFGGMGFLCRKYNCTLGAITQRLEEIHRKSLVELNARWLEFSAKRTAGVRGAFQRDDAAVQLV